MRKLVLNYINGIAFGITETVPGVSGSTIAVILSFYDELIETINHFFKDKRKYLKFLAPFLLGAATGLLVFSSIMNFLLMNFSFPTMSFLIGLVLGIIPTVYQRAKTPDHRFSLTEILMIIIPMSSLIVISNIKEATLIDPVEAIHNADIPYLVFVFFSGIVAAAALIIPAISGSFCLLLLGVYPVVTYTLASVGILLTDITNLSLLSNICKILLPLTAGIIIGVILMAKLIERLIASYYRKVYSIILGLLTGSVYTLFKEPLVYRSGMSPQMIILGIITLLAGCVVSYMLGKKRRI
jgi:putative membrane protein